MSDQATEQSLEERAASLFLGDEEVIEEATPDDEPEVLETEAETEVEDDEATSDETSQEPELETIEIDGEEFQVPPKLKESFMKSSDYTQKTQKLAESMKAIELQQQSLAEAQKTQEFSQSIAPEVAKIQQIDAYLSQQRDWNSMSTEDMFKAKMELDNYKGYRDELVKAVEGKKEQFLKEQSERQAELLEKGRELLKSSINGWNDDMARQVTEYAVAEGFSAKEIDAITDPRYVKVLNKARMYDELQKNAKPIAKELPTIKPGTTKPMPKEVKEDLNFRKSMKRKGLSSSDKARLIEKRLADRFG